MKAWEKVIWHIVSRDSNHVVGHKFQCQTYMSAWYKVSYYDAVIQIIYVVLFNVIDNIYFVLYDHKENSAWRKFSIPIVNRNGIFLYSAQKLSFEIVIYINIDCIFAYKSCQLNSA